MYSQMCCYVLSLLTPLHCREYKILEVLEFNSTRKRMSVVIKDEEENIFLFCKGADRYPPFYINLSLKFA